MKRLQSIKREHYALEKIHSACANLPQELARAPPAPTQGFNIIRLHKTCIFRNQVKLLSHIYVLVCFLTLLCEIYHFVENAISGVITWHDPPIYVSFDLSIDPFSFQLIYLSIYLSIHLSIYKRDVLSAHKSKNCCSSSTSFTAALNTRSVDSKLLLHFGGNVEDLGKCGDVRKSSLTA